MTKISPGDTAFGQGPERYLSVGLSALDLIEQALDGAPAPRRILELACGYGRVTRILRARFPQARIVVADADQDAVAFCARTFDAVAAGSILDVSMPNLGETFDLIWAGSLLAHLPESRTRAFLDVASRHMDRSSRLIVTTHGAHVGRQLRTDSQGLSDLAACGLASDFLMKGYGFRGQAPDKGHGISLIARAWFEAVIPAGPLRLQAYLERSWDRRQDVVVLRRIAPRWRDRIGRRDRLHYAAGVDRTAGDAALEHQDETVTEGFDEAWYLNRYPDVAEAVASGTCFSGAWHYRHHGWRESRLAFDPVTTFEGRTPASSTAYLAGSGGGRREAKVGDVWSSDPVDDAQEAGWYWVAHPMVRARINRLASGNPDTDAYGHLARRLEALGHGIPIRRTVSLGCGFGALERDLYQRGIIAETDAYDLASAAIVQARAMAERQKLSKLRYHVADLERIDFAPGSVDVVIAHSAVHHVERLEQLYAVIHRALRRDGVFHLNEFVGPTRFQWTDAQLELANRFLDGLPARLRALPDGRQKEVLRRPTVEEMIAADPSESVRSSELVGRLDPLFEIVERRDLGGAILHIALGGIAQNFRLDDPEDVAFLEAGFALEDRAMADGVIGSDFAVITAIPRPGRG